MPHKLMGFGSVLSAHKKSRLDLPNNWGVLLFTAFALGAGLQYGIVAAAQMRLYKEILAPAVFEEIFTTKLKNTSPNLDISLLEWMRINKIQFEPATWNTKGDPINVPSDRIKASAPKTTSDTSVISYTLSLVEGKGLEELKEYLCDPKANSACIDRALIEPALAYTLARSGSSAKDLIEALATCNDAGAKELLWDHGAAKRLASSRLPHFADVFFAPIRQFPTPELGQIASQLLKCYRTPLYNQIADKELRDEQRDLDRKIVMELLGRGRNAGGPRVYSMIIDATVGIVPLLIFGILFYSILLLWSRQRLIKRQKSWAALVEKELLQT